mgnify:CR=1 FL=1|tara:strand:+ start:10700 stop:10957 length:258 start_codon:yes stop_codon:yes gene_type:complete
MFGIIWSAVGGFFAKAWLQIGIMGGAAIAVAAVLFSARSAGRQAERVEGMQRALQNVKVRNEVDRIVNSGSDDDFDRLRRKWTYK